MARPSGLNLTRLAKRLRGAATAAVRHGPIEPALVTAVTHAPEGSEWLHELKWDGYRLTATLVDGRARLWSRQRVEWTDRLAPIARALEALPLSSGVFDGELIAGGGRQADFNVLQEAIVARETVGLSFVVFDLLNASGVDVTAAGTLDRKTLLQKVCAGAKSVLSLSTHLVGRPEEAVALSRREGFEGVVSKRVDAAYPKGRSQAWTKAKNARQEVLAVVGRTATHVVLARHCADGWHYAGRARLGGLSLDLADPHRAPTLRLNAAQRRANADAVWFAPQVRVEVDHRAVRGSDGFRHVRLLRVVPEA